jgi:hypothetical protein
MIFKYNLSDSNNNVFYGSGIYRNGSPDTNASKRLSYIRANSSFTEAVPVNSEYNISSGGYSANIGINQTSYIGGDGPDPEDNDPGYSSIAVSSASLSTTSYTLSNTSSLASTSSETLISKAFYYK